MSRGERFDSVADPFESRAIYSLYACGALANSPCCTDIGGLVRSHCVVEVSMLPKLVGLKTCPFMQRVVITFVEKRLPFEIEHLEPGSKPEWFLALSPQGRSPILKVGAQVLVESAAITEFVDESAEPALMPSDALLRADNRAWIETIAESFRALFGVVGASDVTAHAIAVKQLRGRLELLEARLAGPFFNGPAFSLVDASAAPLLQRITWLEEVGHSPGVMQGFPRLSVWRDHLLSLPSVLQSSHVEARDWCAALKPPAKHERSAVAS